MSFYANVFDSKLVVAQIVAMQALSYLSLAALVFFAHQLFASFPLETAVMFDSQYLGGGDEDHPANYLLALCFLANSLCFGIQLSLVVERAKKCLDFCVTYFCLHLVFTTQSHGFPVGWRWWLVHALGLLFSALCGEHFCMKKELQEINVKEFLSMRPSAPAPLPRGTSSTTTSTAEQRKTAAPSSSSSSAATTTTAGATSAASTSEQQQQQSSSSTTTKDGKEKDPEDLV